MGDKVYPSHLKYAKSHEWLKVEGDCAKAGISSFAISQLTDLTYLQFNVDVGDTISKGQSFGDVESVKTASELYSPVSGEVVAVNKSLENTDNLEGLMKDPYEVGWMIEIKISNPSEVKELLSISDYEKHAENEAHHH